MGLGWKPLPLSQKISVTRTRGSPPPTRCSVRVAQRPTDEDRVTTQSRGTPMDAGGFRGTGLMITNLVTTCETLSSQVGAGGIEFGAAENDGDDSSPF